MHELKNNEDKIAQNVYSFLGMQIGMIDNMYREKKTQLW